MSGKSLHRSEHSLRLAGRLPSVSLARLRYARGSMTQSQLPRTIGRFEIVSRMGGGGMGDLFLARQRGVGGFQRFVAIKAIKSMLARNAHFINMFLDEARLAARIQHDNVVGVEEVGQEGGLYYLVMEFLPSVTVGDLCVELRERGRRLDPAVAASIVADAAAGLHAAHDLSDDSGDHLHLVHRDVSPSNVLLGQRGEVKVIDFGIAKAKGRLHVTLPSLAQAKGKLGYMAPEQLYGKPVDRRADLYALGVVFWELLTMERLFQNRRMSMMPGDRVAMPPRPSDRVELPARLDELVMACLEESPEARPQSAWEFRKAVREVVPEAREVEAPERAQLVADLFSGVIRERLSQLGVNFRPSLPNNYVPGSALAGWTHPNLSRFYEDETSSPGSASHGTPDVTGEIGGGFERGRHSAPTSQPPVGYADPTPLAGSGAPPVLVPDERGERGALREMETRRDGPSSPPPPLSTIPRGGAPRTPTLPRTPPLAGPPDGLPPSRTPRSGTATGSHPPPRASRVPTREIEAEADYEEPLSLSTLIEPPSSALLESTRGVDDFEDAMTLQDAAPAFDFADETVKGQHVPGPPPRRRRRDDDD